MGLASIILPYIIARMTTSVGETQAIFIMMGLLLAAAILAIIMMCYLLVQHKKVFGYSAFEKLKN